MQTVIDRNRQETRRRDLPCGRRRWRDAWDSAR